MSHPIRRPAGLLLAAAAILAATACVPGAAGTVVVPDPAAAASPRAAAGGPVAAQLAALRVAAPGPMTGYTRERFGHGWISQGNSCDTREIVLHQQGKNVQDGKACKPVSGTWISLYDGVTVTDPAQLDIDHLVPEAEAWRTGAAAWPQADRERFANDYTVELVAVTAHSNRSKGDDPPPGYRPVPAQWCHYATGWIQVKTVYRLTVSARERDALADMLHTCPA